MNHKIKQVSVFALGMFVQIGSLFAQTPPELQGKDHVVFGARLPGDVETAPVTAEPEEFRELADEPGKTTTVMGPVNAFADGHMSSFAASGEIFDQWTRTGNTDVNQRAVRRTAQWFSFVKSGKKRSHARGVTFGELLVRTWATVDGGGEPIRATLYRNSDSKSGTMIIEYLAPDRDKKEE